MRHAGPGRIDDRTGHTMLSPEPTVTIAVPTFNRAGLLQACLARLLPQAEANTEILVSDNASSDETAALLAGIRHDRFRVIRNATNLGLFGNLNACLAQATGEYILFLSDDDLIE